MNEASANLTVDQATSGGDAGLLHLTDAQLPAGLRLARGIRNYIDWLGRFGSWFAIPLVLITAFDLAVRKAGGVQVYLVENVSHYFGSDMALCLGDWMVAKAFELAARNSRVGGQLTAILAQAMQETCNGQISDLSQRQCADLDEWQRIATGKTAPLLIAPIKGMALAAGLIDQQHNTDWLSQLDQLVGFCGLAYQGYNDIDDIVPSSHRSSDLDGRKPNLAVSLFAIQGLGRDDFHRWYASENTHRLSHWQQRIASSVVILQANQMVDNWLQQAEELVTALPTELHSASAGLVASVKKTTLVKSQCRIA